MYKNLKDVCQSHMDKWISNMEQMVLFGCDGDGCDCDYFDGDACNNCYYNVSVHQTRVMVGCQERCYYTTYFYSTPQYTKIRVLVVPRDV